MRALLVLALLATGACGGAHSFIRADHADYPISLSEALRAEDGRVIAGPELQPVGEFDTSWKAWSALWTLIPIAHRHEDISDEVNAQVKQAGGDGIIELWVGSSHCYWNFFTLLGLLPDCSNVHLHGLIVKAAPGAPPPPPVAQP